LRCYGDPWLQFFDKVGFSFYFFRCAQYNNISSDCTMVADPKDPTCCKVPQCIPVPGPGKTVPTDKPFSVTGVQGVVFGYGTPPPPNTGGSTPVPRSKQGLVRHNMIL